MKIIIPFQEVILILEEHLRKMTDIKVKSGSGNVESHFEGEYEDRRETIDGISFEL